ncbi:MAG: hypothetical protein IJM91_05990 [Lachnospiraceae bacterium]|nr:hypothetical protein [Lachnospiraceae bacterium]
MKDRAPIIDTIDRRNFQDDLKHSIVKRSRIHFVTEEEEERENIETDAMSTDDSALNEEEIKAKSVANAEAAGIVLEDPTLDVSDVDPDVLAQADEIFRRLQAEAEADNLAKKKEWEEKLSGGNAVRDDAYNATTGSYSGLYGKGDISDETKSQAEAILGKKDDDLQSIIAQNMLNE